MALDEAGLTIKSEANLTVVHKHPWRCGRWVKFKLLLFLACWIGNGQLHLFPCLCKVLNWIGII
ncbi:hypothetical protein Taro_045633 [Colocasia esculenta]|uniref:Uncharacterized protein n=1 Tax=Colocasia esculenta TaxID=4460 RepID=A0A843WXI2_COLES|nr:hypothetical protein [Colocasia esculenta]